MIVEESTQTTPEQVETTTRNSPDPERADSILRPIVAWLNRQSRETKMAAMLVNDFLRHEHVFRGDDLYFGDIGQEFHVTWNDEVFDGEPFDDPKMEYIRGMAAFLSKMSS